LKTLRKLMDAAAILLITFEMAYASWSEPVPVPGINTGGEEYYPSITADGSKMYFSSTRDYNEDIYVSTRINGIWTTPVNLGQPVNSNQRDICPSISADGRTLYFVTYNRAGGLGSYDIWYSIWNDSTQRWNEPVNPGSNINSPAMEWSPCISHDGTELYFATTDRFRPGWLFGLDIYISEIGPDGWMPAVNLGDSVNTYGDDYCPSIAFDDTTLYFASWHHHNLPCWHGPAVDLFVAYFSNGHWGNISNLCDPVNTQYWEQSPFIDISGDTLYFARMWPDSGIADNILYSVREPDGIENNGGGSLPDNLMIDAVPNPFNSSTLIRIESSISVNASAIITDIAGKLIRKFNLSLLSGSNSITWNGKSFAGVDAASGLYFITIKAGEKDKTIKITKIK
jgi:hypothetical protein